MKLCACMLPWLTHYQLSVDDQNEDDQKEKSERTIDVRMSEVDDTCL